MLTFEETKRLWRRSGAGCRGILASIGVKMVVETLMSKKVADGERKGEGAGNLMGVSGRAQGVLRTHRLLCSRLVWVQAPKPPAMVWCIWQMAARASCARCWR